MAGTKKRKLDSVDAKHPRKTGGDASPQVKRRRVTSRKTKCAPVDNLLMRLPGELRNKIYEFALDIRVGQLSTKYIKKRQPSPYLLRRVERRDLKAWREPKVLKLSKTIRAEASSIYYRHNVFVFRATTANLQQVYDFVKSKTDGQAVTMNWSVQLTRGKWKDMASWIALAKLVYESDRGLTYDKIHEERCLSSGREWLGACIDQASMEVADIGRKARERERGLGYACVVEDFADWVIGEAGMVLSSRDRAQR